MIASATARSKVWATAPGKVIITGEHAVVYGQPALAAAINRRTTASVSWQPAAPGAEVLVNLDLPQLDLQRCLSVAQLQQLAQHVATQHKAFLAGQVDLPSLFASPEELLLAALGYGITANALTMQQHLDITLQTELLLGGGMGSSASMVAALMAALLAANDCPFDAHSLYQQVLVAEQWQHGRSSGLDPHICIAGGVQFLQSGQYRKLDVEIPQQWFLVASGKPQSSTGECVEQVRQQQHSKAFWQQFGDLAQAMERALLEADYSALLALIKTNHSWLQALHVVPQKVADFICQVEQAGGAGKICGAGSIRGEAGGLVLVAGVQAEQLQALCEPVDYKYWPFECAPQGLAHGH